MQADAEDSGVRAGHGGAVWSEAYDPSDVQADGEVINSPPRESVLGEVGCLV